MSHARRSFLALAGLAVAALAASPPAGADPPAWELPTPEQPAALLLRGATVWTNGAAGVLAGADVLVRAGKVAAVGRGLGAPPGAVVVEAAGKHLTPGIIDAHSHTAVVGQVNESTRITTAEVRIQDVLDADDVDIYRQLAGGVTAANVLHGSANSIGGQNAVIKMRYGAPPEALLFAAAPPGIKFALGENPKQSNWGVRQRRFPQTRMGVEQSIRERFLAARDYRRAWEEHRRRGKSDRSPPRRDLQLEALGEILDGERLVHAHSYRADEILMLLRLADEFGVRLATLQHVLEGYKASHEIARHGAGASGFSDWWAYKHEVIDAIPYNGAIMARHGVTVSFNSDSNELARRLNLEAAKAVRYGGLSEEEALKLVTLNPARQLRVDDRVGSLEEGKDADLVVWSGNPLSTYTLCEQTWVDGRKYFDRAADLERRAALAAERDALMAKVQESEKEKDKEKEEEKKLEEEKTPPATVTEVLP